MWHFFSWERTKSATERYQEREEQEELDALKFDLESDRDSLQRELKFYQERKSVRFLRPKEYWVNKLTAQIKDIDARIASISVKGYTRRKN